MTLLTEKPALDSGARRGDEVPATDLRLAQRQDGQLWATTPEGSRPVVVVRCFPWSATNRFISLRDDDETEIALIEDPSSLEPDSRVALEESLATAGFILEIEKILSCNEEVEIRTWEVQTRQGLRRFQTRRDEWPRELPGGSVLVRDVAGDLFIVRDPTALDRKSQAFLWVFQE